MSSNPREALKKKLWRKINAYAVAKLAESRKYEESNSTSAHDLEVELELQRRQLDGLLDYVLHFVDTEQVLETMKNERR